MKSAVFVLACVAACASAFSPSARITPGLARTRPTSVCSMSSDKNDDMMLKLSLNRMESIKGREGLQGKEAEKAISQVKIAAGGELAEEERKLLGSRRLAKLAAQVKVMASAEEDEDKKLLGSRRVFKFVRAATKTIIRPVRRKNHNGETFDASAGHR